LDLGSTLIANEKKISKSILLATANTFHNSSQSNPKSRSVNNVYITILVPAPTKTSNKIISILKNKGQ